MVVVVFSVFSDKLLAHLTYNTNPTFVTQKRKTATLFSSFSAVEFSPLLNF